MHFIARSQVRSEVHTWLHSIVHSQPAWLMLPTNLSRCSKVHCEYAPKYTSEFVLMYTPGHPPKDAHTCTRWHTARLLDSHTSAQEALKHTPKHTPKYDSNCTRWYTPSLFGSTLPSTLSRGKTLPISLDYMLTCTLLHARSRDLLSCRSQAPGGVSCRRCGETAELEGREPIINTPPHLPRHPKRIREKEQLWLQERRKRVRRYDTTWPWGSKQLPGSTESQTEQLRAKARSNRVCNSMYDKMMGDEIPSIYPGVSRIYTPPSLRPSPIPLLPSPSPSSLYLHTPAVAQSSPKLSGGGGGEKQIFTPQRQAVGGVSYRRQAPGGLRQMAYGGQCLAGGMWHVVWGRWRAAYGSRIMTSVDIIVWTLSLAQPPWQELPMPHGHGVDNWMLGFRRKSRQFKLVESRSPTKIFHRNLEPASHWLWPYVCAFGPGMMVMLAMVMTAMVMVSVMVIIVPEALRQVGWLRQH